MSVSIARSVVNSSASRLAHAQHEMKAARREYLAAIRKLGVLLRKKYVKHGNWLKTNHAQYDLQPSGLIMEVTFNCVDPVVVANITQELVDGGWIIHDVNSIADNKTTMIRAY